MKRFTFAVVTMLSVTTGVVLVRAQAPAETSTDPEHPPPDPVALQAAYEAHLENNEVPAPDTVATDEELIADNFGCPNDTVFWMRDSVTPLCQPTCATDADCTGVDGRCRILNPDDLSRTPQMLLVDDLTPDLEAAALNPPNATSIVMVCDPFHDVVGATDVGVSGATFP